MKNILIFLITFYQLFISSLLRQLLGIHTVCRYTVPCSFFAKEAIETHGALQGSKVAFQRILRCQPFVSSYESTI